MKNHILFVGGDPEEFQSFQRALVASDLEFQVEFTESGAQALAAIEECPPDLVVANLEGKDVPGSVLLDRVMERFPQVVRVIVTNDIRREVMLRSARSAHQQLLKPFHTEELTRVVGQAVRLRRLLEDPALHYVISQIKSLPSLPTLYMEIMKEVRSADPSLRRVGEIVARDVGMSTKVLQIANSVLFGARMKITDPVHAVIHIGLDTTRALVLTEKIFSQLQQGSMEGFPYEELWKHSYRVGSLAQTICKMECADRKTIDDAFAAGMLHDVGKLVLATNLPTTYAKAFDRVASTGCALWEAEREFLRATHAEVGAYLLGIWGLPDEVVSVLLHHHAPRSGSTRSLSLAAVHAANALDHATRDARGDDAIGQPDLEFLGEMGLADRVSAWRKISLDPKSG